MTSGKTATVVTCLKNPWPCSPHPPRPRSRPEQRPAARPLAERSPLRHSCNHSRSNTRRVTPPQGARSRAARWSCDLRGNCSAARYARVWPDSVASKAEAPGTAGALIRSSHVASKGPPGVQVQSSHRRHRNRKSGRRGTGRGVRRPWSALATGTPGVGALATGAPGVGCAGHGCVGHGAGEHGARRPLRLEPPRKGRPAKCVARAGPACHFSNLRRFRIEVGVGNEGLVVQRTARQSPPRGRGAPTGSTRGRASGPDGAARSPSRWTARFYAVARKSR